MQFSIAKHIANGMVPEGCIGVANGHSLNQIHLQITYKSDPTSHYSVEVFVQAMRKSPAGHWEILEYIGDEPRHLKHGFNFKYGFPMQHGFNLRTGGPGRMPVPGTQSMLPYEHLYYAGFSIHGNSAVLQVHLATTDADPPAGYEYRPLTTSAWMALPDMERQFYIGLGFGKSQLVVFNADEPNLNIKPVDSVTMVTNGEVNGTVISDGFSSSSDTGPMTEFIIPSAAG